MYGLGEMPLLDEVVEILPDLVLAHPVGRLAEVTSELSDTSQIEFLGPGAEPFEGHVHFHLLSQRSHGFSSFFYGGHFCLALRLSGLHDVTGKKGRSV